MNQPNLQMVRCQFYRGPLHGKSIPIPYAAQKIDCCLPIDDKIAVYNPKVKDGKNVFVFERLAPKTDRFYNLPQA